MKLVSWIRVQTMGFTAVCQGQNSAWTAWSGDPEPSIRLSISAKPGQQEARVLLMFREFLSKLLR
jgi:hypothetical protein